MKNHLARISVGEKFEAHLTAPRNPKDHPITFRSVTVKKNESVQVTERKGDQSFHHNMSFAAAVDSITKLISSYKRIQIIFPDETVEWVANRRGEWILQGSKKRNNLLQLSHNRVKSHLLPEGQPVPFLVLLGVMKPDGKVVPAKYDKFRQINRFLELVDDVIKKLPPKEKLSIVDFGCGKAYLTFALYHWLHVCCKREVSILGLDLKQSVVEFCEKTARDLRFDGLHFKIGRIEKMDLNYDVDIVVTLHACNTATDAAIAKAVHWNAQAILSVPCCQHELLNQVKCEVLKPLLKHGLLKERFSALITDAARAELLEISGYNVDIVEFVDPEHTPKNLMIRAIKGKHKASAEEYNKFADFLSICMD